MHQGTVLDHDFNMIEVELKTPELLGGGLAIVRGKRKQASVKTASAACLPQNSLPDLLVVRKKSGTY
jgi:hypothetical protein